MINTNYRNQFSKIGPRGIQQKYKVNYEKFSLGITKNKIKTAEVSADTSTNIKAAVTDFSNKVFNETKAETVKEKTINQNDNDYQNRLSDLFTSIKRVETEKKFDEFNKSISSVFQDIENLKNEPNADTESYNALQNNISKMISDYNLITLEQNSLLDEKVSVQKDILNLTIPKPPSKADFEVTNTLPDGLKETVVDEEKYSEALAQYEKDMEEYNTKNQELTAKMNNITNKLTRNDMKLNSLDAEKFDIISDANSVFKLQSMANNSTDSLLTNNLKESQNYLSKIIQKNAENRINKLNLESDFEKININDYSQSEYADKVNEYNEKLSQLHISSECNKADIQYVFYNANLITLINELDKNGTGSKAMDNIIIDSTNEYNHLIEDKKRAISVAFDNPTSAKIPTPPKKDESVTDEEYTKLLKFYEYQTSLYEKSQEKFRLKAQNALSHIDKIDKDLVLIERMLFGHTIS